MAKFVMEKATEMVNQRLNGKSAGGKTGGQGQKKKEASGEGVVVLTDSTYSELVTNSDDSWVVEFYAPWCGHCKSLEPEWNSLPGLLKGDVKVGKVDATVEK